LARDENTGGVGNAIGNNDLLDLVAEVLLDRRAKALVVLHVLLPRLLLLWCLLQLKTLFRNADELLAVKLFQLSNGILINRVDKKQDLETLLLEHLKEGRVFDRLKRLAGKIVDRLLDFGHAGDIVFERGHFLCGLGRMEPEELGNLRSVVGVFMDTELQVLRKGSVEFVEILLIVGDLTDELQRLLDKVLPDNLKSERSVTYPQANPGTYLQNLVLLQGLTRDVQGKVFGVNNADNEVQVFGHHWMRQLKPSRASARLTFFVVLGDKDTSDVELDVVTLLFGFE